MDRNISPKRGRTCNDVITSRLCRHAGGCTSRSSFNYAEQPGGLYCSKHKLEGMINVRNKPCAHAGCKTQPCFNTPGATVGLYCGDHRLPGFVNVKQKQCHQAGCNARPSFGVPGSGPGRYCSKHKMPGMMDVRNRHCAHNACSKCPSFNTPGEVIPLYCGTHKQANMVDVKHKASGSLAKRSGEADTGLEEGKRKRGLPSDMTTGGMQASSTGEPSCIMQQQSCMLDSHEATEEDQSAYSIDRVAERTSALPCSQTHAPDQAGISSGVQLVGRGACMGSEANMPVGVGEAAQGQPQGSFMQMLVEGAAPG